ncbi:MAG: DUF5011 domain-containing protein, partial [bacterium]|nr:DUF5011 domain-containing protein [bacterium]
TVLVKDVFPGGHASPQYLTVANGLLFFTAVESTYGQELWCSDGTEAGTVLVKDIRSSGNSFPMFLTEANGLLFCSADDGVNGRELWQSDGTPEGTKIALDIAPGISGSFPKNMISAEEAVFFSADDGIHGRELWRSDGGEDGAILLCDIRAAGSSNPQHFVLGNGFLYFQASDPAHGRELWTSTGTPLGTELVADLNPNASDGAPATFCVVGDFLFFSADDGEHGSELWVYEIPERDMNPPVMSLLGDDPIIMEQYTVYTDPGAIAFDDFDGEVTANITTNVLVNSAIAGDHTVTYDVSDAAGNDAIQLVRTVRVLPSTPPVITLNGASQIDIQLDGTYTELGATALDNVDGDVTALISVVGVVEVAIPGTYTLTYTVSDAAGNAATPAARTVRVIDHIPPELTLVGPSPTLIEQFTFYVDAGATASDNWDGDITSSIVTVNPVNPGAVGAYTVTYNVSDAAGNAAQQLSRAVHVLPSQAPTITLNGSAVVQVVQGGTYVESGATAVDNVDGNLSDSVLITGTVDTTVVGEYILAYDVADAAGNAAPTALRTIRVVDTAVPVITLLGNPVVLTEAGAPYADAGATAFDNHDGDISASVVANSSVNTAAPGAYTVFYDVMDSSGNPATRVTRIVNVLEAAAPVITLIGAAEMSLEVDSAFEDPGATAVDNVDGNITDRITVYSTVNPFVVGNYFIAYNVADIAGNSAVQVVRTVEVGDATPPVITLIGGDLISLELNEVFTDPGATAFDNADGNISGSIVITGTVDTTVAGSYTLAYDVTDAAGNPAIQATRQVVVAVPSPLTWHVDATQTGTGDGSSSAPFSTIGEALTAADPARGNIIQIRPGLYPEALSLLPYSTLESTGGAYHTWITAPQGLATPLLTLASGCTVRGLTLADAASTPALSVPGAVNVEIANCVLRTSHTGLLATSGADILFHNNTVAGNATYGMRIDEGATVTDLRGIIFASNGTGLSVAGTVLDGGYNCYFDNGTDLEGMAALTADFVGDPRFVDAAAQNYHLGMNSLCRNAGDPNEDANNIDGTRNDIGADGGPGGANDTLVPQAVATATPSTGEAPLAVTLDGSASNDEWGIAHYSWDLDNTDGIQEDATGPTASHSYEALGARVATLTVTDHSGLTRQTTVTINVGNGLPIGTVSRWPLAGPAPLTVQFNGQGTDPDGGPIMYLWDFDGDGTPDSPEQNPSFTYPVGTAPGSYTVSLRLVDDEGASTVLSIPVTVTEGLPDSADEVDAVTGGTVEVSNPGSPLMGAQAILPAGALATSSVVTMGSPTMPYSEPGHVALAAIEIGPSGTALSGPATLVVPHNGFDDPASVAIRFYDGAAKSWQPAEVTNIQSTADWTSFDITRFGAYAVVASTSAIDVNSDGYVNALDIQILINTVLGMPLGYDCDVNDDGYVNALDMQIVINAALGI